MINGAKKRSRVPVETEGSNLVEMLAEARALVNRLEDLIAGSSAGHEAHPIIAWRKRRNMHQNELAKAAGISGPALSRIEHLPGFRGKKETRAKIAAALDVPEEWLIASNDPRA